MLGEAVSTREPQRPLDVFPILAIIATQGAVPGIATHADEFLDGHALGRWQLLRQIGHLLCIALGFPGRQGFAIQGQRPAGGYELARQQLE